MKLSKISKKLQKKVRKLELLLAKETNMTEKLHLSMQIRQLQRAAEVLEAPLMIQQTMPVAVLMQQPPQAPGSDGQNPGPGFRNRMSNN